MYVFEENSYDLFFWNVAQVPARIEKLIAEKQFYAAVQLHLQSAIMLEREGLQTVGFMMSWDETLLYPFETCVFGFLKFNFLIWWLVALKSCNLLCIQVSIKNHEAPFYCLSFRMLVYSVGVASKSLILLFLRLRFWSQKCIDIL